ncbi:unnamed protein product [Caenorhabditis brenneri]
MAQASVLAQLEAVSAELQMMYARNNHLVIALDEQSRISLHRLEYIRMMQDNSATVIELQATVNDLQTNIPIIIHCGHTICRTCALIMARPTGLAQPNRARIQILSCPVCRQDGHFNPQHVQRNYACLPGYVRPRPNN